MMPKKTAEIKTSIPVQTLICIRNKKIGNAARASTIKKRALRAESRQCAVSANPAICKPQKNNTLSKKYIPKCGL